jgi:translation initiation factor 2 subunit 2
MDPFRDEIDDLIKALPENMRSGIPKLEIEVQGKRTIIKNFISVAKEMQRDPQHISKYLSSSLGVQTKRKNKQLILRGILSKSKLETTLMDYANQFIICPNCGKPDTILDITKNKTVLSCLACGYKSG